MVNLVIEAANQAVKITALKVLTGVFKQANIRFVFALLDPSLYH
jgi:hypothetical protein